MVFLRIVLSTFIIALFTATFSNAATLTVTNLNDSGAGSLRQAIAESIPGDTIEFAPNLAGGTINLESEIAFAGSLEISGPKPEKLTLDGQDQTRIFNITGLDTDLVSITGLIFRNGFANQDDGGAILVSGPNLEINHCKFDSNRTFCNGDDCGASGGALKNNEGGIEIIVRYTSFNNNSTQCIGNDCSAEGGAFANGGGETILTFTESAFVSNSSTCSGEDCDSDGGAFHNGGGGGGGPLQILFHNSTFALNTSHCSGLECSSDPGAFDNAGGFVEIEISNSTFDRNSSTCTGEECRGFISSLDGVGETTTLINTILNSDEFGTNCDEGDQLNSLGFNIDNGSSCINGTVVGDKPNTNPLLDPRSAIDNGGPTPTVALLAGSPAIDMGSLDCPPPDTDQRGFVRPQGARCDIGAFEGSIDAFRSVPTISQWGLIAMASLLGIAGFLVARRRQLTA